MFLIWEQDSSQKKGRTLSTCHFLMSHKKFYIWNLKRVEQLFLSYRAKTNDELTFPDMAIMNLVETSYDGWPVVEYNGKQGKVPAVLLEPYKTQEFLKQDK